MAQLHVTVSPEEKAAFEALALAEGVTVSTLAYRRMFNKPDAVLKRGRRKQPKSDADQPIEELAQTG